MDAVGSTPYAGRFPTIKDQATKTLGDPDDINHQLTYDFGGNPATDDDDYGPRYHYVGDGHSHSGGDPEIGTCDTTHPLNFGWYEGPCKDFFPVVEIVSEVELYDDGYVQGIFILAEEDGIGTEFELEGPLTLVGIIIGRGCVELEQGSTVIGSVFVDGDFYNDETCDGDEPLEMVHDDTTLSYSTCAAQRALSLSGIGTIDPASAVAGALMKLGNRSFQEIIR